MLVLLSTRTIRWAFRWLALFSLICLGNCLRPIFVDDLLGIDGPLADATIPPCVHFACVFIVLAFIGILTYGKGADSDYIRDKYPELWQKLHWWSEMPVTDLSSIGQWGPAWMARWRFLWGGCDDVHDERLNDIRHRYIKVLAIFAWSFCLIPMCMFLSTFLCILRTLLNAL